MTPRNTKFYLRQGDAIQGVVANNAAYAPDLNKAILCGGDGYPQPSYSVKVNDKDVTTTSYLPYQNNGDRFTSWGSIPNSAFTANGHYSLSCTPQFDMVDGPTFTLTIKVIGSQSYDQRVMQYLGFGELTQNMGWYTKTLFRSFPWLSEERRFAGGAGAKPVGSG